MNERDKTTTPGQQPLSRREFLKLSALVGFSGALAACGVEIPEAEPTPGSSTEGKPPTPQVPTDPETGPSLGDTPVNNTDSQIPTETPEAPVATPTRPELSPDSGGPYTDEQIDLITQGKYLAQEDVLDAWVIDYWGQAENRPFHPESSEIHYKYLFDIENPEEAIVLLEAGGDYQGRTFREPMVDGEYVKTPPEIPGDDFDIPEGMGPFEVGGGNYILANVNGQLVRIGPDNSVKEEINQEGQWEEVKPVENQGVPEEFGEIAYTEMHDAKEYAIDQRGYAVAVKQSGEWKKYERPIITIAHPNMMDEMAKLMEAAESVDERRLLTQDGKPLPYGVLSTEMYDENDGYEDWREMVFLSGFVIGAHLRNADVSGFKRSVIYVEIPLRYQRVAFAATTPHLDYIPNIYQFSDASIPLDEDGKFDMDSTDAIAIGNQNGIKNSFFAEEEFVRTMQNPNNTGVQILVGFVYKAEHPLENFVHTFDVYQEYISKLEKGELDENVYFITNIGMFGIPDGLFEEQ